MKDKNTFAGIVFLLLELLLGAGTAWLFSACPPTEEGKWMSCHWAGRAVIGSGIVLIVLAVLYLLISKRPVRAGISLAVTLAGLYNIAVLNGLIELCKMPQMQCRSVMQPAITIISAVTAVIGAVNSIWILNAEYGKKEGAS